MKAMAHLAEPAPCDACGAPARLFWYPSRIECVGMRVCEPCRNAMANPCFRMPEDRTPQAMREEAERAWQEWSR